MFYSLSVEVEKKGNFGGRDGIPLGYNVDASDSQGELSRHKFPDFEPCFSGLLLSKKSTEVDFIKDWGAIGGEGYIISEKVLRILNNFKLPEHRFYPLTYLKQGKDGTEKVQGKYFWWQIILENRYDWIDFSHSEFILWEIFEDREHPQKIQSVEDLLNASDKVNIVKERLTYKKIVLNSKYAENPQDFFFFEAISWNPFISENLINEFKKENVSGIEISKRDSVFLSQEFKVE